MEKFSAYRDSGTGIQPFLTPLPPSTDALAGLLLPLRYVLATVRTALILVLLVVYVVLVPGFCTCLDAQLCLSLGLLWISEEHIQRKRNRDVPLSQHGIQEQGDVIVTNWVSWIELVWLAVRFNPIFVRPIPNNLEFPATSDASDTNQAPSGRRRPVVQHTTANTPRSRIPITSFQGTIFTIHHLHDRTMANRPIVVLPECTTSNGRGLLRFSPVFRRNIPVKEYQVFVMCVRYEPPSTFAPSAAHCIPNSFLNPLPHLFGLATALKPIDLQIRLLAPAESPSSPLFMLSDVISGNVEDELAEASAALIAQLGKLKRTNMGWEDKTAFLEFYHNKSR
ncbi:hypothetical protein F5887DRAFT_1069244 [Amanita rubescens]|nr:hypothetical protein F5887DRAFT_1069244 [Amanita rubescens]